MLVNVKFFKKKFLISFFLLITTSLLANEKDQIVAQLKSLNSLEFTFDQLINEKTEKGSCLLEFPGKLKCNYFDDKKKELVINNKRLAITQKKYNKTYYYPVSKSPFLNILYKDKLLEIVQSGKLEISDQIIAQLNSLNSLEFTFDQLINEKTEKGSCLLEFPGKLLSLIHI